MRPRHPLIKLIHLAVEILGDHAVSDVRQRPGARAGRRASAKIKPQKAHNVCGVRIRYTDGLTKGSHLRIPRRPAVKRDVVPAKASVVQDVRRKGMGPIARYAPDRRDNLTIPKQ